MATPYLDASAIAPLFFQEADTATIETYFGEPQRATFYVSDFAMGEFTAICSRLVRMNTITVTGARAVLNDAEAWRAPVTKIDTTARDVRDATALVARFDLKLRLPDAIHLAICQRLRADLVTFDKTLRLAAEGIGIGIWQPALS